ncbi:hypothetical protein BDN71DRAFT_1436864 [Pleurotus eryngii]|uniref:Uncharacterized protein n=1 Tax=Pleurotus eryngii TaxID=5323 RepID=A0A9P5ZHZ6_PLEER|nr:hypothetical protein BDN71DRAFT_1436864 [Pleurotus eryngii]
MLRKVLSTFGVCWSLLGWSFAEVGAHMEEEKEEEGEGNTYPASYPLACTFLQPSADPHVCPSTTSSLKHFKPQAFKQQEKGGGGGGGEGLWLTNMSKDVKLESGHERS